MGCMGGMGFVRGRWTSKKDSKHSQRFSDSCKDCQGGEVFGLCWLAWYGQLMLGDLTTTFSMNGCRTGIGIQGLIRVTSCFNTPKLR